MREVNGIEGQWRKPKDFCGRWTKGCKLVAALVGPATAASSMRARQDALVRYEINEETHNLTTEAVNPNRTLLKRPAINRQ